MIAGQLPNLILSGVDAPEASEASGLQGTAQNLGMALGTAVIGTVILSVALNSFGTLTAESTVFPDELKSGIETALDSGLESADRSRIESELASAAPEIQQETKAIYDTATIDGYQGAILVGGIVALIGALIALRLPKKKLEVESAEDIIRDAVRNPTIPKLQFEMEDLPRSSEP